MFNLLKRSAKGLLSTRHLLRLTSGARFILCYHHLARRIGGVDATVYTTTIDRFKEHLSILTRLLDFVPLDELIDGKQNGQERNRASITFDDGFMSVYAIARPILRERGIPYTVFLNGCALVHGRNWMSNVMAKGEDQAYVNGLLESTGLGAEIGTISRDPVAVVGAIMDRGVFGERFAQRYPTAMEPVDLYMGRQEVAQLVKEGVVIGDHSWDHAVLSRCEDGYLQEQLARGAELIAEVAKQRPQHFALPFGKKEHFNDGTLDQLASLGFATVHTTNPNNLKWSKVHNGLNVVPRIGFTNEGTHEVLFYLNRSLLRRIDL